MLVSPTHITFPTRLVSSHSLSLGGSQTLPFLPGGPWADSTAFLWHCVPFAHSPALGDWWASWGGSPVLHSRFPSYDFIVTPLGGGGGRNITPSVPWDARQITRSICRSHMKGTGETARAQGSVMWRWLRLEVLDPRFSLMIEYHMHLELNLYLL